MCIVQVEGMENYVASCAYPVADGMKIYTNTKQLRQARRANALYSSDRKKTIRRSHDNPEVQRLYKEFSGRPLSEKAHELLHTHYKPKEPRGIVAKAAKAV